MEVEEPEPGQEEECEAEQGAGHRGAQQAERQVQRHRDGCHPRHEEARVGQVGSERWAQHARDHADDGGGEQEDHVTTVTKLLVPARDPALPGALHERVERVAGREDIDDLVAEGRVLVVDRGDHVVEAVLADGIDQLGCHAPGHLLVQGAVGLDAQVLRQLGDHLGPALLGGALLPGAPGHQDRQRQHGEPGSHAGEGSEVLAGACQDAAMIRTERHGSVLVCTIDRPDRRNAVDAEHLTGLRAAFEAVGDARALVLTGEGSAFCAGADLTHVEDRDAAALVRTTLDALSGLPICTIAAVHGPAMGAGMQLALSCDLRVVGPGARFGIPSAKLGLMVDHWTIEKLALLAGHGPARAVLLAADTIDAESALRTGFAQRAGDLADAIAWAEDVARLAPLSVAGQKLALDRLSGRTVGDADVELAFDRAWTSEDRLEGVRAFHEKRPARFRGV